MGDTKFIESGAKVFGEFGGIDTAVELSLHGRCSNNGLLFGFVGDCTTSETKDHASDRAASVEVSGMSSIEIPS